MFGVRIIRFIRWSSNDGLPSFDLEIEGCETVHFDSEASIIQQQRFRSRVLGATSIVIPTCRAKEWEKRVQALFNVREDRDTGAETSHESTTMVMLEEYLDSSNTGADSQERGILQRKHWITDDHHHFFLQSFIKWAGIRHHTKFTAKELGRILRAQGAITLQLHTETKDGRDTTRMVWRVRISGSDIS